jgi:hypothetical protein
MYVTREVKRSLYMKYERSEDWYDPQTTVRVSRTALDRTCSAVRNSVIQQYLYLRRKSSDPNS